MLQHLKMDKILQIFNIHNIALMSKGFVNFPTQLTYNIFCIKVNYGQKCHSQSSFWPMFHPSRRRGGGWGEISRGERKRRGGVRKQYIMEIGLIYKINLYGKWRMTRKKNFMMFHSWCTKIYCYFLLLTYVCIKYLLWTYNIQYIYIYIVHTVSCKLR